MRVAVVGASGNLGSLVARELLARGHAVTAIARDAGRIEVDGAHRVAADVTEPSTLDAVLPGHDAVVVAVTDRSGPDRSVVLRAADAVLAAAERAGVARLAFMGGGGSLEIAPGLRAVDAADFPDAYKPEALAQAEALAHFRAYVGPVEWTYLSPPPHHLEPGEKTGRYRAAAGDSPVVDEHGESRITTGDLALALVDELERPRFARSRFTAAS